MSKVEATIKGIKNKLNTIKPAQAIAEYIWNGFDAHASEICINYESDDLGNIAKFSISDNGSGIPYDDLETKFKPILSSSKHDLETQHTLIRGKNGLGRLTFYRFCHLAEWNTVFLKNQKLYEYNIKVNSDKINHYNVSDMTESSKKNTGTTVTFKDINNLSEHDFKSSVLSFLIREFAWVLELNKGLNFLIKINNQMLDYSRIIKDSENISIVINEIIFNMNFVRWAEKLNKEYSNFYCLDLQGNCKYLKPTTFNNKGDAFHHSVFVQSDFFENFKCESKEQSDFITLNSDKSQTFKCLVNEINNFLAKKRSPFLIDFAKSLVDNYEKEGIFPNYNPKNKWEKLRADDLKETVIQLYKIEPHLFSSLNIAQKKTFMGLLSLLLDHGESDDLFKIIDGIINLSSSEREQFAKQLKITKLSSIIKTIELISDRYKSVEELKKLVFDPNMYAKEVPHLQKMMERNYWLIGEEYQLLTAAEPDFEEALRRFCYILHGETDKKEVDHLDKNKEMDIFLIRQDKVHNKIENVVLELKHPRINLGKTEIDQIYSYYQVIKSEPRFNASNMDWKFFLIGNKFNESGYIENQIITLKNHGEAGLVFKGEYRIYAFRWSEIFTEFELRHNFLDKKLKLERDRLIVSDCLSADDILENTRTSDSPQEIQIPKK